MTCLIVCAREAAPLRMTGLAVALIVSAGWIGMGLGGYLAGYFYDATGNYVISYAFAAVAGAINLLVLIGLMKYRRRYAAGDVVKI
jgi:cyanate permease